MASQCEPVLSSMLSALLQHLVPHHHATPTDTHMSASARQAGLQTDTLASLLLCTAQAMGLMELEGRPGVSNLALVGAAVSIVAKMCLRAFAATALHHCFDV